VLLIVKLLLQLCNLLLQPDILSTVVCQLTVLFVLRVLESLSQQPNLFLQSSTAEAVDTEEFFYRGGVAFTTQRPPPPAPKQDLNNNYQSQFTNGACQGSICLLLWTGKIVNEKSQRKTSVCLSVCLSFTSSIHLSPISSPYRPRPSARLRNETKNILKHKKRLFVRQPCHRHVQVWHALSMDHTVLLPLLFLV